MKHKGALAADIFSKSLPSQGAWIETQESVGISPDMYVAPFAGGVD